MKKKILFISTIVLSFGILYALIITQESEVEKLKHTHATFLKNHPYTKTLTLTKAERKAQGLPPGKYFEQEYLNEINPNTGRIHKKELFELQKKLNTQRLAQRTPGDASDNAWVERGPNNVGGRTRAVIFDPNDTTHKRVFAGGVSGGLWVNNDITDGNSSWTRVGILENLTVSCIAIDPNNSNIWYVGTGESYTNGAVNGNGVWKTVDGGVTWNHVFGGVTGDSSVEPGATFTVNSPASIAGSYSYSITTAFGVALNTAITGDLVLADDGINPNEDGCTTFTNAAAMNGKIAVIRRGSCNFDDKVKNAQNAGAIAVIMVNNVGTDPFSMGGDDTTVTIPSAMVSMNDGNAIIAELGNTVNVTLLPGTKAAGYNVVPGVQHVNDIVVRNNNGVSEVFIAAAESFYSAGSPSTLNGVNEIGIYKSTNGTSFAKLAFPLTTGGNAYEPNNIKIAADNSIYVSTLSDVFGEGGGAIFQSTDGVTFTLKHTVSNGRRTEIAVSSTNADVVYVLAQLSTSGSPIGMYKTIDGFTTTTAVSLPSDRDTGIPASDFTRGQSYYDLVIEVDPTDDTKIYAGGIDLFRSTNSGTNWTQISKWSNNNFLSGLTIPLVHADQHALVFHPTDTDKAIIGNDGGVFYASSLSSAISSTTAILARNNNYNVTQFYHGAIGQDASNELLLSGAQDNGTQFVSGASAGINSTTDVYGGDGAYSFIDKDGEYMIVSYVYNVKVRFTLPYTGARVTISNDKNTGSFINPSELDDHLDILYTNSSGGGTDSIARFTGIKTFSPLRKNFGNALLTSKTTAFKVSPYTTSSTKLFVGTANGLVLKIDNANTNAPTWSKISNGLDVAGSVSSIEFGKNEDEILVAFHNYGVTNIWFTEDGGTTWASKEGDFPDIPVKAILMNPLNNDEVIIGTELGVWRTGNFKEVSPKWAQSNNGMSNVKVTSFSLRTSDNTVMATSYGRGMFTGTFTAEVASIDDVLVNKKAFTLYPTVSDGNFTVFAKNTLGKSMLYIFDINGKQVFTKKIDFNQESKQVISVNLKSGIYIVNLLDVNNKKSTGKIIIK